MADFLMRCNVFGGPLRNEEDACLTTYPGDLACNDAFCPGGCASCAEDMCSGLAGIDCTMNSPESVIDSVFPDAYQCQTRMTMRGTFDIINYFTYDKDRELCAGYPSGRRTCHFLAAAQTLDLAGIQSCQTFL